MTDLTGRGAGASGTWGPMLSVGFGLLLVLVSAGLFAAVPGELADIRAYAAAPACPAGTRADTCATRVPAIVEDTEREPDGRGARYWLLLTEQGSDTVLRVHMDGSEPVYDTVRAGDEVTLVYWRGDVRTVEFGAVTQETRASPAGDWRLPLGLGLLLLPFGIGALSTGWWYRYRYSSTAPSYPWGLAVLWGTAGIVGCVGFFAGSADSVPDTLLITAAGVPPAAGLGCLLAWWLRRRMKKAEDTGDIVAIPVKGKRCLRATVYGDVPYSVDGFGHLVVGDGRPAATPDPTGVVARRELPETLTVERVRAFRPDDPQHWAPAYEYDGVAIECRDGDRTVLIATGRRDAPLILGALTDAPTIRTGPGAE
ncbi:hypothetical protein [Streptomyces macrosporus]|uniref:DUF3592 domain-containing protein n=1 Tax=Streptomyces macrosporus TaxID=44032 RepID=A0ABP5XDR8_9ACTN